MTTDDSVTAQQVLAGFGWMVLSGLLFVAVSGIVRHLGSDLPAPQAAFLRYGFGLLFVLPILMRRGRKINNIRFLGLHAVRGTVHAFAVTLWFFAMARIPIAEVAAIGYVSPIFITIGAAVFLRERLHFRRIAAVLTGLFGVVIILRPGFQEIQIGSLAQLTAAPLMAASFLIAKRLTATEDTTVIVAMLSMFCTLALAPLAMLQWRTPSIEELVWLMLVALLATAGHYTLTQALRAAPITMTLPATYLQLVWATALGALAFGEQPDIFIIFGGGCIVAATTYIAHRERQFAVRTASEPSGPC
jgi:drug/metabolite transporter (DMT)-like permease